MRIENYVLILAVLYSEILSAFSALSDYKFFPGLGYYRHVGNPIRTWPSAFQDCRLDGGHLVIINSQAEADAVIKLTQEQGGYLGFAYWVGITDYYITGTFYDIKGNTINQTGYEKWIPGQPDQAKKGHCVMLYRSGLYDVYPCESTSSEYVCEIEIFH